jgi:hypothetical protein
MPNINFRALIDRSGSIEGARALFQKLITSLIRLKHKDASEIRPYPGDWGIDVLVGNFVDSIFVWQVKYFIDGINNSQKSQIRDSFNTLMENSKKENFRVDNWKLCIPCNLSVKERQWWDTWSKKMTREHGIPIQLKDESTLRSELETFEARHLSEGYFGSIPSILNFYLQVINESDERDIVLLPDQSLYDDSLFIRKLEAAYIQELISAKTQFFNAELISQEIFDKNDSKENSSLLSLYEKLRSMWETRFNLCLCSSMSEVQILYPNLMQVIEQEDMDSLRTPVLKLSFVHKQGMVHQLADKCHVGWTRDFRKEFKDYI